MRSEQQEKERREESIEGENAADKADAHEEGEQEEEMEMEKEKDVSAEASSEASAEKAYSASSSSSSEWTAADAEAEEAAALNVGEGKVVHSPHTTQTLNPMTSSISGLSRPMYDRILIKHLTYLTRLRPLTS